MRPAGPDVAAARPGLRYQAAPGPGDRARPPGPGTAASSRLFQDAIPFLRILRSRGMLVALVSNCAGKTRQVLSDLGVPAAAAVVVDDQPAYCAGAAALGMTALQIARGDTAPLEPAPGTIVIRSLLAAAPMS